MHQTMSNQELRPLANAIRALAMDAVEAAKSGHPGMPMGMADAATVLFAEFLNFDPKAPDWPNRDRFVLSAGHGSMLLYALLHLTGYEDFPIDQLRRFRQLGAYTAGHPEYGHGRGIETTTGPLGQGLANAVGMAMAERALAARFGDGLVDHKTYVIAGDGCLMEGISHEAAALAGKLKLNKLIVLWDDNDISIDGAVSLADSTDQRARFDSYGWRTLACDGHDFASVRASLLAAQTGDQPVLIACKTKIGFGAPNKAGTKSAHGEPLGPDEIKAARQALDWPYAPFEIPAEIESAWLKIGRERAQTHDAWRARLDADPAQKARFLAAVACDLPEDAAAALSAHAAKMAAEAPAIATRAASGKALEAVFERIPTLIGGSADLTGSNLTLVKGTGLFSAETPSGRYVHYGVREHAMAAAMNGMALHGGVIPYGGTFLCFADYSRPAIRLAALMGLRVIHVMTHDSIGLGEDGPTHQPVEHLASLRAMPGLLVIRPADAVETAEAWGVALEASNTPSILALSRQAVPSLRTDASFHGVKAGAYEILPADGQAQVSLFASGTEVAIAIAAQKALQADGVRTRVVSCPCFELFAKRPLAERAQVIGSAPLRIGIEAGIRQGWDLFLRPQDDFIGMTGFGASAPAPALYEHFGLTAANIAARAKSQLGAG